METMGAQELMHAEDFEPASFVMDADNLSEAGASLSLDSLLMSHTEPVKSEHSSPASITNQQDELVGRGESLISLPEVAQLADSIADVKLENEEVGGNGFANRATHFGQHSPIPSGIDSLELLPSFKEASLPIGELVPVAPQPNSGYSLLQTNFPTFLDHRQFPSGASIILPTPQSGFSSSLDKDGNGLQHGVYPNQHLAFSPATHNPPELSQNVFTRHSQQGDGRYGSAEHQIDLSGMHRISMGIADMPSMHRPEVSVDGTENEVGGSSPSRAINNDLSVQSISGGDDSNIITGKLPKDLIHKFQDVEQDRSRRVFSAGTAHQARIPFIHQRSHSSPSMLGNQKSLTISRQEAEKQFNKCMEQGMKFEAAEKLEEALAEYQNAFSYELKFRYGNDFEVAKTHSYLARTLRKLSRPEEAISSLERALGIYKLSEQTVDSDTMWHIHDELAQAYGFVDTHKEIENYERAIEILCMSTDVPPERLAHMHNNVGVSYHKVGKFEESKKHLLLAQEMMNEIGAEPLETAKVYKSLGDVYLDSEEDDLAIEAFKTCQSIYTLPGHEKIRSQLDKSVQTSLDILYSKKVNAEQDTHHKNEASNSTSQQNKTEGGAYKESVNPLARITKPSMFGEVVEQEIRTMPDRMKAAQADDYAEMGRKRREDFPRLAQQYFESSFQIRNMMIDQSYESSQSLIRDCIDAGLAYLNGDLKPRALEYLNFALEQPLLSTEDRNEILSHVTRAEGEQPQL
ncbi:uncharacterized protein [Watersipora subatra]|uniref:uncharacterized protein n=1 Tax=Watersipora subatra TaxID=2589382 RepID=UPI00355BD42E